MSGRCGRVRGVLSHGPSHVLRAALVCLALAPAMPAMAQAVQFANQNVGTTSSAQSVTVTFATAGTLNSIQVLTQGAANQDFALSSTGSCTAGAYSDGASCTVDVTFTPKYAGVRMGAVVLKNSSGSVLGTAYVWGIGNGPQVAFATNNQVTLATGAGSSLFPYGRAAVDGNNNVYFLTDASDPAGIMEAPWTGSAYGTATEVISGLTEPSSVAVDGAGNLYVVDDDYLWEYPRSTASFGSRVNLLNPERLATGGLEDVAVTGPGDLFVTEGNTVLEMTPTATGFSTAATIYTGAADSNYTGIAVDSTGDLFVTELTDRHVIELSPGEGGYTATTLLTDIDLQGNPIVDAAGNIYFDNGNVVELPWNGSSYGSPTTAFSFSSQGAPEAYDTLEGMALDAGGNMFLLFEGTSQNGAIKLDRADPPTLSFSGTTNVGTTNNAAQAVTLTNIGNQTLTFSYVSYPTNFPRYSGDANLCSITNSVAVNGGCDAAATFYPTSGGTNSGNILLGDNAASGEQSIPATGTGDDVATQLVIANLPPTLSSGGNAGAITVSEEDPLGHAVASLSNTVTLSVSGPGNYAQTYTATASAGVATFNLSAATLNTAGGYVYTADGDGLPSATGVETVGTDSVTLNSSQAIGSPTAAQAVAAYISRSGVLGSIQALTRGAANLDFTASSGGTCSIGADYSSGSGCTVDVVFTPKAAGLRMGAVVLEDSAGNVLGTTFVSGVGTGPQITFSPATQVALPNPPSAFAPGGRIAVDGSGNVFVADSTNGDIIEIPWSGSSYGTPVVLASTNVGAPGALAIDGAGNLYVLESGTPQLVKFPRMGSGYGSPAAVGLSAGNPVDIAVDGAGNVYVADSGNGAVVEVPWTGTGYGSQTTVISAGAAGYVPTGVAVDASGNVYFTDSNSGTVVKVPWTGSAYSSTVVTVGSGFSQPLLPGVDAAGNVYAEDAGNGQVADIPWTGSSYGTPTTFYSPTTGDTLQGTGLDTGRNLYVLYKNSGGTYGTLKEDYADGPVLSFPTTTEVGTSDVTDAAQTATLTNVGNQSLTLTSGTNPSYPQAFPENTSAISPALCAAGNTIPQNSSCDVSATFFPIGGGTNSGRATVRDNAAGGSQAVTFTGTGVEVATQLGFGGLPGTLSTGGNAGTITVYAEDLLGNQLTSLTGTVTLTVTGPSSYSQTYTAAASGGIATFDLSSATLSTSGTYLYSASDGTLSGTTVETVGAAWVSFGSSASSQSVAVSISTAGTLNTIQVLTQGAPNLDFTQASGGTCSDGTAYTTGQGCTVNVSFTPKHPGTRMGAVLLEDAGGNVLGITYIGGTGVVPQIAFGPGVQVPLTSNSQNPRGMAVDGAGNVYIVDEDDSAVLEVPWNGTGYGAEFTAFSVPYIGSNIAVDGAGNLYVTSSSGTLKYPRQGSGFGSPITVTYLGEAVAVDAAGNVYISTGQAIKEIPWTGSAYGSATTIPGSGSNISSIALDGQGNLYFTDYDFGSVTEVPWTGSGYGSAVTLATVSSPSEVQVDAPGNLYVAEDGGSGVVELPKVGSGYGSPITLLNNNQSNAVALDAAGNLYIAYDSGGDVNLAYKLDLADPPSDSFPTITPVGNTDTVDGSLTVTVTNNGTAQLTFSESPVYPASFPVNSSDANLCGAGTSLAAGDSCDVSLQFQPSAAGVNSGSLTLADNAVNSNQALALSGTGQVSVALGSSQSAGPAAVSISSAGTLASIEVLTEGVQNLDFTNAGTGTCTVGNAYTASQSCTVTLSFSPTHPGLRRGAVLLLDASGNVLGTTYVSDVGVGPQIAFGSGAQSTISLPGMGNVQDMAVDGNGDLFVLDISNGNVAEVPWNGSTYGTPVTVISTGALSPAIALDAAGNLYLADDTIPQIWKYPRTSSGFGTRIGLLTGGSGNPTGLLVDGYGNIYFSVDSYTSPIYEIAWTGNGYASPVAAINTAEYGAAYSIAMDANRNFFFTDQQDGAVFEVPWTSSGYGTPVSIGGEWSDPGEIQVGAAGNLYVANAHEYEAPGGLIKVPWTGSGYGGPILLTSSDISAVALDAGGNVYINNGTLGIVKLDFADAPTLSFADTGIGHDTDSAQTLAIANDGNAALTFSADPIYPPDFPVNADDGNLCEAANPVAQNSSCDISVNFEPFALGPLPEQIAIADNTASGTHAIPVTGTSLDAVTQVVLSGVPANLLAGGNAGTLTVSEEDPFGTVQTTAADTITLTVTGPNSYSATYTATAAGGVATFNLASDALTAAGTYIYAASLSGVSGSTATETVLPLSTALSAGENVGSISEAVPATVYISTAGTLNSIQVLTQGAANLDFAVSPAGSCVAGTAYSVGQSCTVNVTFSPQTVGQRTGAVVLRDAAGNLLGIEYLSGVGAAPEAAMAPGTQSAVSGVSGAAGGVALDPAHNLYLTTTSGTAVKLPWSGSAWGSPVTLDSALTNPQGIAVDGAGNVYIAASQVIEVPWSASAYGTPITVGTGISGATAIAVDAAGNLYINQSSGVVELPWTGSGYGAPVTVLSAPSVQISAVTLDASGNLYVAESALGQVVEVPWSGTSWGSAATVLSGLTSPQGLTFDGSSLCIVDGGSGTMILVPWTGSNYGSPITAATGLTTPSGVAVDDSGIAYAVAAGGMVEIDLADGSSLMFPASPIGSTNTASPQTATLINAGNQPLTFSVSAYPALFPQNTNDTNLCAASGSLNEGVSCDLSADFAPTAIGPNAGTLTVTDDTLDVANSTQSVALSGTGLDVVTQLAMSTVPPSLFAGGNAKTITVSENDSSGVLVSTATDTITLLVTGPSGYSQTYTAVASGGVATFDLSGDALSTPGTYNYAASLTGVTGAEATESVFPIDVNLSSGQSLGSASSAQSVSIYIATAGTLNSIQALTEGIANGDFTATNGGTCATGTAYTVGQSCTVNVVFNPQYAGLRTGAVVLTDSSGAILGTVYLSGTGLGPQIAYPPGVQSSVSGSNAYAVAVDGADNLYYVTGGSPGQAIEVPWTGTTWGTPVTLSSGLNYPYSIAVDGAGNVYIGELLNGDVLKLTWNGTSYSSTPVTVATGVFPSALTVDRNGNVYIASGSTVVEAPWTGNSYGSPVPVTSIAGGGVAVDAAGNVYTGKNPATPGTSEGTVIELPWTGSGWGAAETLASGFYYPTGVALDGAGSLYVADLSGETLTKIPWTGSAFGTPVTLASGLPQPQSVALDASGNVYIASYAGGEALKLDLSDAPSPAFPTATDLQTLDIEDSPQTVTILNIGNQPLTFSLDPSYPPSFPENSGDANLCSSATPVAEQSSCDVSTVFQPTLPGAVSQSVTLTDNAVAGSQTITFNGTSLDVVSQLAVSGVPAQLLAGTNAGTATVSEEGANGAVMTGAADTITLTVTGPNNYSQTYTATATAGVATFGLTGATLTAAGPYTYTASLSGVPNGTATETVYPVAIGFSANTNVTSSSSQAVPVYVASAGTVNAIQVLTQGAPNLDFTDAGGDTCATATAYTVGQNCTVNVAFTPQRAGTRNGAVILMDASGNVLGETFLSAVGVAPQIGFLGAAPAAAISSGLTHPADLAMDGSGNLYVVDSSLNEVLEFTGSGTSFSGPVVIASGFSGPLGIAVDGAKNIYVADTGNNQIVKVPWTGVGTTGYGTPVAVLTGLSSPHGVAVDGAGNLYAADTGNNQVLQLPWVGTGYGAAVTVASGLSSPWGVAVDASGDVYFSDAGSGGRVAEVPWSSGSYGTPAYLYTGSSPQGLALDNSGNLYIARNGTVIELPWTGSSDGSAIATTATGSGVEGVVADASGNFYLAESTLAAIARVDVADPPTLVFPTATTQFSTDTTDGPQTTVVINNGNAPLPLFSGINPAYPSQFPKNTVDTNLCASGGSIAEAATCDLSANFAPIATGAVSDQIILIDNTLNVTNTVQYINLNGTGLAAVTGIEIVSPPQAVAGTPFTISAAAQQPGGGANGSYNGTVAITSTDPHASLPPTVTFSSGEAFFSATLTTAGNQTITLNDASVSGASGTSSAIQVTAAAPSSITASAGTPQSAYVNAPFATPLTILVTDSYNNPVDNADVTFTVPASGASAALSALNCFTDSNGICQVTATANAAAGSYQVTATINGTSDTVSFSLTNNPPPNLVVTTSADDAGTAANCTVQASTTTGTDDNCSLRDALLKAAALGQANIYFDNSEFGSGSGIAVSSPLAIPSATAIVGPTTGSGPTLTSLVTITVNGSGFADITVNSGVTDASISNMTITEGSNSGSGGCLVNAGGLTLTSVALTNCFGSADGGIIENTGSLTLENSNLSTPTYGPGNGGCIDNSGTLQLLDTTIANCNANGVGGAINNSNFAILENSSLYGNGGQSGGGIENSGTLYLVNTTLYENSAGSGGGVDNTGTFAAFNVTFSGNWAASGAAGISNSGGLQVENSILAGDQGPECLATAGSCPTNGAGGNVIGVANPGLLPLANYGGSQLTLMPLPGSAAICAGSSALVLPGLTTDERGLPLNASCVDAGAVQTNYVQVNTLADTQNSDTSSCTDGRTCSLRDAVLQSAANPDIGFAPALFQYGSRKLPRAATLTLSSPLALTQTTMNLAGPGANLLTISGGGTTQLFTVNAQTANISAMTLASGKAANGGAILHTAGNLNIDNVEFSGNQATQNGGAIDDTSSSTLTIANSTLANNSAGGSGGGLALQGAALNLLDSTLTGNSAASGGGLSTTGNGSILLSSSTVTGNAAPANGSGWSLNATVSYTDFMVNSILAGNTGSSDCVSSGSATCPVNGDDNGDSGDVTSASGLGLSALANPASNTAVPVMVPLPGSAAICVGTPYTLGANNLFLLTDARGVVFDAGGYCASGVDAGAVQTDYALTFTAQPSNVNQDAVMRPVPAVTLDENGAPFTASAVTIPLTLTSNPTGAVLTGGSVSTSRGVASYANLSVNQTGTGDQLTAMLTLNPAITPTAPTITAASGTFNAAPAPPFGAFSSVVDATTGSTTVTQGDSVLITGWAADVNDGAPISSVSVSIDGGTAATAALGIVRPGIAAKYGSADLNSGWTYTYSGTLANGTHTVTAVLYDSGGRSTQLPILSFTVSAALTPPYGELSRAVDAATQTTPIGQNDGLLVTGWAADLVQGAPVSQVTVSLDGTSLGNATLSAAGPSGEPANSGWTFTYSGSALTAGTHTVSVVAYDSGGRSATLGSRTITVQADVPPYGGFNSLEDATTKSTTVTQGDSVLISGWAVAEQGASITQVTLSIDGGTAATATLGIARPGIAAKYGSADLDSGWTYTYSGALTSGTHTVTAVLYDSGGRSTQLPILSFTVSSALAPPYGAVKQIVDAVTRTTPIGQSDGLLVTGWAADLVQGAPVSQVAVSLDGTSLGNATLSAAGPSGEPANSGWTFTYSGSALTAGTHTVTAVAYDSGGRSATLGSRTITVQASVPPFGAFSSVEDATTKSTTVTQGDSVLITGWAADVTDGAPIAQVTISIDGGTPVNATLDIARPGIAAIYGSAYLHSGWTYTYSGTLTNGTHTVTAVLYASGSRTTQLSTRSFTVSP